MTVREHVLEAALRVCRPRRGWTFRPAEIVAALPDTNKGSVRTHVMSRCCVNAPAHHGHRWPYFRRVRRGVYEILPAQRRRPAPEVAEPPADYKTSREWVHPRGTHVKVRERAGSYVARVPGVPDEIHGATLDEVASRLRNVVLPGPWSLHVDIDAEVLDPVVEAFEKDIDRSQLRRNLRRTPEQRLEQLQQWIDAMDQIRGTAQSGQPEPEA